MSSASSTKGILCKIIDGICVFIKTYWAPKIEKKCDPIICEGGSRKEQKTEKLNPDRLQERVPEKARQQERQRS